MSKELKIVTTTPTAATTLTTATTSPPTTTEVLKIVNKILLKLLKAFPSIAP